MAILLVMATQAHAAPSLLWDDVLHPNRLRCSNIAAEARRAVDTERPDTMVAARVALEEALVICGDRADVHAQLGRARVALHDYAGALPPLERARALAPDDDSAELAFNLGFARYVAEDFPGALREYRRAERAGGLSAKQWQLHAYLGDVLMALGRLSEAIDAYRRAVQLVPMSTNRVPHLALAVAYERDDQLGRARETLASALGGRWEDQLRSHVLVPSAEVYYVYYVIHDYRGNTTEARRDLERFLEAAPRSPYAARARERLNRR